MTNLGHNRLLTVVADDETIYDEFRREILVKTKTKRQINAPYAAWKFAHRRLYGTAFGPRDGKLAKRSQPTFVALRALTKELNYIDSHPALSELAMFGTHADIIPAWRVEPAEHDRRVWSPYPQPGHQFAILTPIWNPPPNELTWWVPHDSAEGRLSHEAVHLRCWREQIG